MRPIIVAIAAALALAAPRAAGAQQPPPEPHVPAAAPEPPQASPQPPPNMPPARGAVIEAEGRVRVHGLLGDSLHRTPGLAAALSLNPFPVDLGNLYADNVGWGLAYTGAEVALLGAAAWMMWDHMGGCPCHGTGADGQSWSRSDRLAIVGVAGAYVGVKLAAAFHAAGAARAFNRKQGTTAFMLAPTADGGFGGLASTF